MSPAPPPLQPPPHQRASVRSLPLISRALLLSSADAAAGSVAEENLGNMRTVAAFGGEKKAQEAFHAHVDKAKTIGVYGAHVGGLNMGLMMAVMFASYGLGFWCAAVLLCA